MPIILLGLFLRILIAFWNGFIGPSLGAGEDATKFHLIALHYSNQFGPYWEETMIAGGVFHKFTSGWFYPYILGQIYSVTTNSIFLGCLLTCFAWLLSAIILDKILRLLEFNNLNRQIALFIYILLPSSLMFTSVTLREGYQLLFVNLSIYSSLLIIQKRKLYYLIVLFFSMFAMSMLHKSFILLSIFLIGGIFIFYPIRTQVRFLYTFIKLFIHIPIIILIVFFGILFFEKYTDMILFARIWDVVSIHQGYHKLARATYIFQPEINNLLDLVQFYPKSLLQYLFEPMPWRVSTYLDVVLLCENIIRGFLILMAFNIFIFQKGWKRSSWLFVFLTYFFIESLWALGTVNWGTAARHHIPSIGLLLIIALISFSKPRIFLNVKSI